MKAIKDMNLAECIDRLRELPNGTVDDANVAVMFPGVPWIFDVAEELADRIHELTRWIPVEERLPTQADADEHGYVQWWDENEVALPCSHYWDFTGKPTYKFTHWRRIDKPEDL